MVLHKKASPGKQQAETPSAFQSSGQLPAKLHAEPFEITHHCLAAKDAKDGSAVFQFSCYNLDKDFIWFGVLSRH